jgi:endonuclease III
VKRSKKSPRKREAERNGAVRVIVAGAGSKAVRRTRGKKTRVVVPRKARAADALVAFEVGKRGKVAKVAARARRAGKTSSARSAAAGVGSGAPRGKVPRTALGARRRGADAALVLERLGRAIPRPHVELAFESPWQLLIAVILAAQSTDRRVNQVTPEVFRRWPDPAALAGADPAEVEEVIKSTGFFRNKTRAITQASALLVSRFGAEVPRTLEELVEVPGVARKTANVVLGAAHRVASGIVVDTHVGRVSQRLGLTRHTLPEKIEVDLCARFPAEHWIGMSHRLVLHGRYVCTARAPACAACPLNEVCPSRLVPPEGTWEERADEQARDMEVRSEGFTRV